MTPAGAFAALVALLAVAYVAWLLVVGLRGPKYRPDLHRYEDRD